MGQNMTDEYSTHPVPVVWLITLIQVACWQQWYIVCSWSALLVCMHIESGK